MKCLSCECDFDFESAAEEFNAHFDEAHDYAYEGWDRFCADCAITERERLDREGED